MESVGVDGTGVLIAVAVTVEVAVAVAIDMVGAVMIGVCTKRGRGVGMAVFGNPKVGEG